MKKIEKFFNKSVILINEKHKNEVRDKIMSARGFEKEKPAFFYNFKFYLGTVTMLLVIILTAIMLKFLVPVSQFGKSTAYRENEINSVNSRGRDLAYQKKHADKNLLENAKSGTLNKDAAIENDAAKTEKKVSKSKSAGRFEGEILFSYVEPDEDNSTQGGMEEGSKIAGDDQLKNEKLAEPSIRESAEKSDSFVMKNRSENGDYGKKLGVKSQRRELKNDFKSSGLFNTISIIPDTGTSCIDYLQGMFKTSRIIDKNKINVQEIINYFGKNYSGPSKGIYAESVYAGAGRSFVLLYYRCEKGTRNFKLHINFREGIYYKIAGYEGPQAIKKSGDYGVAGSIIILIELDSAINDFTEFGSIKAVYFDNNNIKHEESGDIAPAGPHDLGSSSELFRLAYFGFMIGENLKNGSYSGEEITEYKKNYLDNKVKILSKYQDSFYNEFIQYEK